MVQQNVNTELKTHKQDAIVRDSTWYPTIRCGALDVLTGYEAQDSFNPAALHTLILDMADRAQQRIKVRL